MRFLVLTAISLQILSLLIRAEPESPPIRFYNGAQNPQNLEFKENMTLLQAIALGGSGTESSIERVAIFRKGQRTTYHDIGDLRSNPSKDVKLTVGDILFRNKKRQTHDLRKLTLSPAKDVLLQPNDKIIVTHR